MTTNVRKHIDAAVKAAQEATGGRVTASDIEEVLYAALPHLNEARMAARRVVGLEQQPVLKTNRPALTRQ